ncbi:bifunctional phosphoribosylaminoimidazolecarboxamide formyltransferase/IMP cyclohydrolase [Marinilactibacillus psychrotolerans]|uniref:Bifunctional purine biosynthesis protein PurH n=1 Tax=Marinilactibacillus psychrotolerans TaxID=191770 RepID=A0AAV3WVF3_9LACT|nr:bifunctional phosphoribosylaminoimidazolecarboxamide formyltransferase/IMP cyclohydrolase [Marinilactibacillus psychrotolerans]GEL67447.1 bifunctional purine biosynthesis protein PurH [Marinilactibacillus psychrotolerans]GEQ35607.1 bifunctional phosphoribosylaminoimidazolecarboxamide formyltransferase / IMP cyclohydrolase [Marinilactibacillus psychrotolerans]SDC70305.1 phosphoribosylaminoimidazolecarboxamide formyltransferase / IMP cyclohydrolase [Marinilactibacillus psychrotolerans]
MKRALISVSDKTNIVEFAQALVKQRVEIISTGGTKNVLDEAGVPTVSIDEVTGFPEMMDGRVKTLHPLIHGGLLGRRDLDSHLDAMKEHNIQPIDFVCVNLYPFKETISRMDVTPEEAIEQIDIGGPSMLRSAAKNFASVTVVVDAADYTKVIEELQTNGQTSLETRKALAAKVFRHTASYDALIADYLTELSGEDAESVTVTYNKKQSLRYGENSHQSAVFYEDPMASGFSIAKATQLHGKELSYNNIKDADAAIRMAREFDEPVAVAVKHMNPCGIGIGETIEEAFNRAYEADSISIFGGIVVINREVSLAVAEKLHQIFLEIVIAPSFSKEAFDLLSSKKNIRLLELDFSKAAEAGKEMVSVLGGLLIQAQDWIAESDKPEWKVVTETKPTDEQIKALALNWKVVKHVKSNAIVVGNTTQTLGIGAGQMNRIGAAKIAIEQAEDQAEGAVLASDAFFPMDDSVEYAARHGIKAIIQPGGSIKDQASIDKANEYGIAMVFTATRHFRH